MIEIILNNVENQKINCALEEPTLKKVLKKNLLTLIILMEEFT